MIILGFSECRSTAILSSGRIEVYLLCLRTLTKKMASSMHDALQSTYSVRDTHQVEAVNMWKETKKAIATGFLRSGLGLSSLTRVASAASRNDGTGF